MTLLDDYQRRVDKMLAKYQHANRSVKQERARLKEAKQHATAARQAQQVVQEVAQQVQQKAHQRIAKVVTRCLAVVFGEDAYEFKIVFEKKRGSTSARLVFVRDGQEYDPLTACGGGVVDVASFSLRLACLILAKPPARRLLVMDEPFRFVSQEYRPLVRGLLETLASEMDIQIILVTHDETFHVGKVVEVS